MPKRLPTIRRFALWAVFFLLYALTTARDILPADSGEFQLAAAGWGILHPPGYPLYTLAGALWVRLTPLGSIPFRLNLFSAALAATTLVLVMEAVRTWAETWGLERRAALTGGLAAALLLGAAPTFWAQAATANIRMPTLLFAAWGFLALAQFKRSTDGRRRPLLSLALAVGLGVGHHPSLIFVALGWACYLLLVDISLLRQPRRWLPAAGVAALAWLIPQLYLPIRGAMSNVPLAATGLNTWHGFWHHVLARGFAGDMFAFANPADLALRLPLLRTLFEFQFPPLFLGLAFSGWLWLLWRHWKLALALFLSWIVHTFVTITYRAPQTVEYLMPAYLPVVLALGLGAAKVESRKSKVKSRRSSHVARFTLGVLLILLIAQFPAHFPDFLTLAADTSVRERVAPLLEQAPPDALLLADWRWATPLWVLQQVEGLRPDVEVAYVYPVKDKEYEEVWRERAEAAGDRPVLTTHAYEWDDWLSAPVGGGYRLYRRPLEELPAELAYTPLAADLGPVRLLGYRLHGDWKPGRTVEVQLAWQASGPQEPAPSFTARLFDAGGAFLTHADRFLGSDTALGEVRFTNLTLQLPWDACPGVIYPNVGIYTVSEGDFNNLGDVGLPEIAIPCELPTLPAERLWPGVALRSGPLLRSVDYDARGEQVTAYLQWCGPGKALFVQSGETQRLVEPLPPGRCQTVSLPIPAGERPQLAYSRPDGTAAHLLALPLPMPRPGERYIPFGDQMVLVGDEVVERSGQTVVELRWRAARPLVDDYAVSVRLQDADGTNLGVHDMQPALGAIPTLKWVARGAAILDPHPFPSPETTPATFTVVVYERFRGTRLWGPEETVTIPWP